MYLLAIKSPICMRKIIMTLRRIATITFLDTGCLMLIFYWFHFGHKSKYLVGGQGRDKFFDWEHYPPCPLTLWLPGNCPPILHKAAFISMRKFHFIRL